VLGLLLVRQRDFLAPPAGEPTAEPAAA